MAARAVDFNGTALTVVAQHLRWPWPGSQWRQLETTRPQLERFRQTKGPVLIGGDFNAAPWSAALSRYADLTGTRPVAGIGPTWFFQPLTSPVARWAGLPIDNVLVSGAVTIEAIERQAATASDHLPVLVTFSLERPQKEDAETTGVAALTKSRGPASSNATFGLARPKHFMDDRSGSP